jgi:hypothetical protein
LLGRVLPLQVSGNIGSVIGAVNIVSASAGQFLTPEDINRLYPPPAIVSAPVTLETFDEGALANVHRVQP